MSVQFLIQPRLKNLVFETEKRNRYSQLLSRSNSPAQNLFLSVNSQSADPAKKESIAFPMSWNAASLSPLFSDDALWQEAIPIDPSGMRPSFYKKLKESNRQKSAQAPFCLIVQAKHDHNGALAAPGLRFNILCIAKTHLIGLIILGTNDLRTAIRKVRDAVNRPIDLLLINAHGRQEGIRFGIEDEESDFYHIDDVRGEDFQDVNQNGQMILFSCSSAKIGQKISSVQDRVVQAPDQTLYDASSYTHLCPRYGLQYVSYDENKRQQVRAYHNGKPLKDFPIVNDEIFQEMAQFYKEEADSGDRVARFSLGYLHKKGLGFEPSLEKASKQFEIAAKQGFPEAQHEWGSFLYRKYLDGDKSYLLAAIKWCSKAADQGYSESNYTMGYFLENGEGVPRSVGDAIEHYRKAADQGHKKAKEALKRLQSTTKSAEN